MRLLLLILLTIASTASAATTRNNDSCDISVAPAATLLLPYFEVDVDDFRGETTIFTVTNVTNVAQVARVTLWTDFSYPVYSFNIVLTGYDLRTINLYDVFHGTGAANCGRVKNEIPASHLARLRTAFSEGRVDAVGCNNVGGEHENGVGYLTIDVVGNCGSAMPTDPKYFTEDLRWDNVLIGDYQQVNANQHLAQGSPMVHIRAIGESIRGQFVPSMDKTFYRRFQTAARPNADGRQPLPSTFAARWINGGEDMLQTSFKIWREASTGTTNTCADYAKNEELEVAEVVMFDEDENGEGMTDPICTGLCVQDPPIVLPTTALVRITDEDVFAHSLLDTEIAGWVYLNLDTDDGGMDLNAQQAWVTISMREEGRYSIDMDAVALGNGCTDVVGITEFSDYGIPNHLPGPASNP